MSEAVLIDAIRTPIGNLNGALAAVRPDDLAALVIEAIVERNHLDPHIIDEVYMGCANQAGEDNRNVARMATLLAGLPPVLASQPAVRRGKRLWQHRGKPPRRCHSRCRLLVSPSSQDDNQRG